MATISPLSPSRPICSLRQDRRRDVPCFSTNHSPAPPSFRPLLSTSKCSGPAAQCRVIRHRESEAEQIDDGADEPFGLPQCETEDRAHRQRRGDCQGRIMRLPAGRGSRFRPPRRDGRIGKPDGQTAAPPQCCVVLRPVRDPIPGFRNMMTVFGMVFERHGGEFPVVNGASLPGQALAGNPADPCNNVIQARRCGCRTPCSFPAVAAARVLEIHGYEARISSVVAGFTSKVSRLVGIETG